MGNISEFFFGCSVPPLDAVKFLKRTNNNPAAAIRWFIQQVITGNIEPEEYRNAVESSNSQLHPINTIKET